MMEFLRDIQNEGCFMKETIEILRDCLEVLNQIPNTTYWSHQEKLESRTYTLASKVETEIKRLELVKDSD